MYLLIPGGVVLSPHMVWSSRHIATGGVGWVGIPTTGCGLRPVGCGPLATSQPVVSLTYRNHHPWGLAQTGPNRAKPDQTGPNGTKPDPTGPNMEPTMTRNTTTGCGFRTSAHTTRGGELTGATTLHVEGMMRALIFMAGPLLTTTRWGLPPWNIPPVVVGGSGMPHAGVRDGS